MTNKTHKVQVIGIIKDPNSNLNIVVFSPCLVIFGRKCCSFILHDIELATSDIRCKDSIGLIVDAYNNICISYIDIENRPKETKQICTPNSSRNEIFELYCDFIKGNIEKSKNSVGGSSPDDIYTINDAMRVILGHGGKLVTQKEVRNA